MSDNPTIATAAPRKRLALFLDGTWNTVGDNTNVWRLKSLCAGRSADGLSQRVYYDTGLGTQFGEKVRGGMFGYGLSQNILDAYEWLIDNYSNGDELFIFGFSRGAYTARSLAGFIAKCGLLKPGAPLGMNQLYQRYRSDADPRTIWALCDAQATGKLGECTLEEQWMLKYSMAIPIKMVGVWDTVGALGVPFGHIPGISRSSFGFLTTGLRLSIEHAFHALAVDEHRNAFSPTLWTKRTPKSTNEPTAALRPITQVEQRWFVGAHANVGGGCRDDLLAQTPLRWILNKASLRGLTFKTDIVLDDNAIISPIADSYADFMYGAYRVAKFNQRYYRPIGEAPRVANDGTHNNINETIDASVFERWRLDKAYRPTNLVEWAGRYKVDVGILQKAVRADAPQTMAPD